MFGKNNDNSNSSKLKLMRSIIQINEMASFSDFQEIEFSTKRSYLHIRYNNVFLHYFYTDSINPPTEYEGEFDKNTFLEQIQQLKCSIEEMFQQSRLKKSKLANAVDEALLDFNISFEEWKNPLPFILEEEEIIEEIFDEEPDVSSDLANASGNDISETIQNDEDFLDSDGCLSEFVLTIIFFAIFIGMAIAIAWMFCFAFSTLLSALYN